MILGIGIPTGWLTGRKELDLLHVFHKPWQPGGVALIVVAVALGGVSSNLLASLIAEHGWAAAFRKFPVKSWSYAALVVACAIVTTLVVAR